jgi:hypothetical protein
MCDYKTLHRRMRVPKFSWIVSGNCQRTIQASDNAVEQAVINSEAKRRLLAAFINGLTGVPGRQVRLQIPDTVEKALNMSLVAATVNVVTGDPGIRKESACGRRQP